MFLSIKDREEAKSEDESTMASWDEYWDNEKSWKVRKKLETWLI